MSTSWGADGKSIDGRYAVRIEDALGNPLPDRASVGAHANAWNNVAVLANGVSNSVDIQNVVFVAYFGNVSAASTITPQFSQNNIDFYDYSSPISANGNFGGAFNVGARYIRLKSSAAVTITATIAAKN